MVPTNPYAFPTNPRLNPRHQHLVSSPAELTPPSKRSHAFARLVVGLGERHSIFPLFSVVLMTIIWVATAHMVRVESTQGDRGSRAAADEFLQTYASQAVRALREIDFALKLVQFEYSQREGDAGFEALRQHDLLPSDFLFDVAVTDANGIVRMSNRPHAVHERLDSRLLDQVRAADIFVSGAPKQKAGGGWTLQFARPWHRRDGKFAGAVVIAVDADYFVSGYDADQLGNEGLLGLAGQDAVFRVTRLGNVIDAGARVFDPKQFAEALQQGSTPAPSQEIDGTWRYVGVHPLGDFPLVVVVGPSIEEALAPSRGAARMYVGVACAATAVLGLFIAMLWRMSLQLAHARQRELAERIAHAERAEHMAYHDALTGLPNRAFFAQRLAEAIDSARRSDRPLAVLFLDLDHFKQINDTLGHYAGDALLAEVARRLHHCVRGSDCVARLGGDEFVVLLSDLHSSNDVHEVASKMLSIVAAPFLLADHALQVTVSIGVSVFPEHGSDEQALMKHADAAMYEGKRQGRNVVRTYASHAVASAEAEPLEKQIDASAKDPSA